MFHHLILMCFYQFKNQHSLHVGADGKKGFVIALKFTSLILCLNYPVYVINKLWNALDIDCYILGVCGRIFL